MFRIPSTIFEVQYVAPSVYWSLAHLVNSPILLEEIEIDIDIIADPITVTLSQRGNISHYPPAAINPALNQTFIIPGFDIITSISGIWLNVNRDVEPIEVTILMLGTMILGKLFSSEALLILTISMGSPEIVTTGARKNWIKWANIGNLDFTIWKDNIAGERPLDWRGWIYAIKKLGNKVIVYGEGGVSMLAPSGNTFGLLSVHKIGLKGRQAIAGDDKIQFFIDVAGELFSIGEIPMKSSMFESSIIPERLDYSEYLGSMSNPVLSWDALNKLLYICDGMSGYIYSLDSKSLGAGPANVTGVGSRENNLYIAASSTIINLPFEICTDIYDMGSRKNKTISTIELGTDVTGDLWVSLDYRKDKAADFRTLAWHKVSPNGVTDIPCYGVEFRVRVKKTTYAYFELDYIRVNGIIHNYIFQYPFVGR